MGEELLIKYLQHKYGGDYKIKIINCTIDGHMCRVIFDVDELNREEENINIWDMLEFVYSNSV